MSDDRLTLPDVNVLVALTSPDHVFHRQAHSWLAQALRIATTPVTESGLLRMLLNPAVVGQVVTRDRALAILRGFRSDPRVEFLADDSTLADPAVDTTGLMGHRQVTDWHLLNLAVRHGGHLVTFDRRLGRAVLPADAARIITLA